MALHFAVSDILLCVDFNAGTYTAVNFDATDNGFINSDYDRHYLVNSISLGVNTQDTVSCDRENSILEVVSKMG